MVGWVACTGWEGEHAQTGTATVYKNEARTGTVTVLKYETRIKALWLFRPPFVPFHLKTRPLMLQKM